MTEIQRSPASGAVSRKHAFVASLLLPGFVTALFLSALLLFAVQPIFARMVLAILGGSPAVWSVAMCFFQLALLGGYAYAHWINDKLRTPLAVVAHLAVTLLAIVCLPLAVAQGWSEPPASGQHFWVLGLFAVSIGLPFFALAGNSPLLQAWFARTGHKHAQDPYFLYGSSNLGSLLALLSYPVLVEPAATLAQQSEIWSLAYKILAVLVGICGLAMLVSRPPRRIEAARGKSRESVPLRKCLVWMGLAFVPSGLLVAVTSHITTDVAAAPFLWVVPLALFLLTFVITFQRTPVVPHRFMLAVQPVAVGALAISMAFPLNSYWLAATILHLAVFFICSMVCHGELVRRRPGANNLTNFYLWMSLGGAAGGLFAGLLAPQIFSTVLEYPVMIALALLARPGFFSGDSNRQFRELGIVAVVLLAATAPKLIAGVELTAAAPTAYIALFTLLGVMIIVSRPHPVRLAGWVAATLVAGAVLRPDAVEGTNHRGFFGVVKVVDTSDGKFRLMKHGTTLHGAQALDAASRNRPEPLTYYHRGGPFADVIAAARRKHPSMNVAAVGLGTGSLACYRQAPESWRFFEIDPIVVRLASDPDQFNFLSGCAPDADVVIGDARLTLGKEPDGRYDLIILDAFSSDAIPVHLLTREAIRLYLSKLTEGGILAFHVSNRNMDLRPVLAATANELGLVALTRKGGDQGALRDTYKAAATMVAFARDEAPLAPLREMQGWRSLPRSGWRVWTDDYSNVLRAIMSRFTRPKPERSAPSHL